jgi:predicted Zn finger-like uncharacterized protein
MLIVCQSCSSKIRVPDGMAGKKGKCPKCGLVFTIPDAAAPPTAVPDVGIKSTQTPAATPKPTPVSNRGAAPPPLPPPEAAPAPVSRRPRQDDLDEEEDEAARRRSRRDDDDDDDEPRRRRSRRDEDDDDFDDIRRRLRKKKQETGLSLSSMIVGIVSASLGLFGICCWILIAPLAGIGGVVAVILGFMGRSRGGESMAITGIVLGFVAIGLALLWSACGIGWLGVNVMGGGFR